MINLQELQRLATASDIAFFTKRHLGEYVLANAAAARLVGLPDSTLVGKRDAQLFEASSAEIVATRDQEIFRNPDKLRTYDSLVRTNERWVRFATTKLVSITPEGPVIVGLSTDVSSGREARRAEEFRVLSELLRQSFLSPGLRHSHP